MKKMTSKKFSHFQTFLVNFIRNLPNFLEFEKSDLEGLARPISRQFWMKTSNIAPDFLIFQVSKKNQPFSAILVSFIRNWLNFQNYKNEIGGLVRPISRSFCMQNSNLAPKFSNF